MQEKFFTVTKSVDSLFEKLIKKPPCSNDKPKPSQKMQGVYLFSEGKKHLYVGRSNNIGQRYNQHCKPGATHNHAVFAFKIARNETGYVEPTYRAGAGSRKDLEKDPVFFSAFKSAKERVAAMDFRYVEVQDQTQQALLEIYCAIELDCPFNSFKTH